MQGLNCWLKLVSGRILSEVSGFAVETEAKVMKYA